MKGKIGRDTFPQFTAYNIALRRIMAQKYLIPVISNTYGQMSWYLQR